MNLKNTQVIHRLWINGTEPPENLSRFGESWADERVFFWTADTIRRRMPRTKMRSMRRDAETIWGDSIDFYRAMSDWLRLKILESHGGLYVDMDCEKVGDVWSWIRYPDLLHVCRPLRPTGLSHTRPCNGILYAPPFHASITGMREIVEARMSRLALEVRHGVHTGVRPAPVTLTGPDLLHHFAKRDDVVWSPGDFGAFKGQETEDTSIVIHQNWRQG